MTFSKLFGVLLASASLFAALPAAADDADKAACASLDEGDDCTRGDGDPGVCIPDESDASVLTCDDDTSSGAGGSADDNGSGCSATGRAGSAGWLVIGGVALALASRGRRAA